MKLFRDYKSNAWGRRIIKDYKKMPQGMKILFVVAHYVSKNSVHLAFITLLAVGACITFWVSGTWLVGGQKLLSDSSLMAPSLLLLSLSMVINWVIPAVLNASFNWWYYSSRANF